MVPGKDGFGPEGQLDVFNKLTPIVHSKRRPIKEQMNKQDQAMNSELDKKTPNSILKSLVSDVGGKDA